jgi:tetratricopeptide (TPR) repeat protein
MGEYDKAGERYIKALDLDTLRFRADSRINEIIRSVAGKRGEEVYLVDAVKVFEQNSPQGIAGEELFYEHVHFNFKGTYILAKAVYEQVEKALPEWIRRARADERGFPAELECARQLAFTDWDRYRIADEVFNGFIKKPPFTNQLYYKERVGQMTRDLGALKANLTRELLEKSADQYREAIEKRPDDWILHYKYGKLLAEDLKEYQAAAEEYRLVQDLLPHSWIGYNALGSVLYAEGDINGAIQQFEKAIRMQPTCSYAHYDLGRSYRRKGNTDEAIEHYSEAVRCERDCMPAYNNWAEIMVQEGKVDEAIEIFRRGLVFCPDSAILHCNLGSVLSRKGQTDEAIKELETALQLDPNSAPVRKALESLLKRGQ